MSTIRCACMSEMELIKKQYICFNSSCKYSKIGFSESDAKQLSHGKIHVLKMEAVMLTPHSKIKKSVIELPIISALSFIKRHNLDVVMLRIKYMTQNGGILLGKVEGWPLIEVVNRRVF